ncbi:hypothetical protein DSECCO2_545410 [anaerobic digester metagenome]
MELLAISSPVISCPEPVAACIPSLQEEIRFPSIRASLTSPKPRKTPAAEVSSIREMVLFST